MWTTALQNSEKCDEQQKGNCIIIYAEAPLEGLPCHGTTALPPARKIMRHDSRQHKVTEEEELTIKTCSSPGTASLSSTVGWSMTVNLIKKEKLSSSMLMALR